MAKLSIAMTTYNGEKFVKKQLLSLLNQTRKADEVIIRDDCSADKTAKVVKAFIEENNLKNWIFQVNEKNLGYKRNFYEAISQTTGDVVFLCDQDDIWMPEKLQEIERVFEKHTEVLALNSSFQFMNSQDIPFETKIKDGFANQNLIRINNKIEIKELVPIDTATIIDCNISPGCTMAFRKEVREIYLQNSDCDMIHDWNINLIAGYMQGLYYFNVPLIQYRIHENNAVGLDGIIKTQSRRGNLKIRSKVLGEQLSVIQMAKQLSEKMPNVRVNPFLNQYTRYINARREIRDKKSILAWLQMFFFTIPIWNGQSVRFKIWLGDFVYWILKRGEKEDG